MQMIGDYQDHSLLLAGHSVARMPGKFVMQMVQDHDHFW
jgi:hypothetical protein